MGRHLWSVQERQMQLYVWDFKLALDATGLECRRAVCIATLKEEGRKP